MKWTQSFITTFREFPHDAEITSHRWLARAGLISKHASGLYTFSPLFFRVVQKVAKIVEEEMNQAGALQMTVPLVQSSSFWEKSGRLPVYQQSKILFELQDRHGTDYCLSPTAEEAFADYVNRSISSYKQLPITLYQQNEKFRDEFRPRFGLLRSRQFIMKDAYSFDLDEAGLDLSYQKMREAYQKIFDRCGLNYIIVQADSGAIGGTGSEEFLAPADCGEDMLLYCEGYAANVEKAVASPPAPSYVLESVESKLVETPAVTTIEGLTKCLDVPADQIIKSVVYQVIYEDSKEVVVALIRGDLQVNDVKLLNFLNALEIEFFEKDKLPEIFGASAGFIGPIGLPENVRIVADHSIANLKNAVCAVCRDDVHQVGVEAGRDFPMPELTDLLLAQAGFTSPNNQPLKATKGIELGHIFKLGTKYSDALQAGVQVNNQFRPFVMGCYGIGTTRIASAFIEQNHDEHGIIWNTTFAPYQVVLIPIKFQDDAVAQVALALYQELKQHNVEVLLDDRDVSAGIKFKDSDMLGFPIQIVLGQGLKNNKVELKIRKTGQKQEVLLSDATSQTLEVLKSL